MTDLPRTAWVIGASSGIGAATARLLADRGVRVAVSARRAERLEEVSEGRMSVVPLDVTDAEATHAAFAQVVEELGLPDLVLYASGRWEQAQPRTWSSQAFADTIAVNLLGLGHVLDDAVPAMVERGSGRIAVIASVAGYRGLSGSEYYGATKAAQINLCESLRASLGGSGVEVTTICPGFVETEMTASNDFPMPFVVSAQDAARAIVEGLAKGKDEIVFPLQMELAMKGARVAPLALWTRLTRRAAR